jgi:hypothetical protein
VWTIKDDLVVDDSGQLYWLTGDDSWKRGHFGQADQLRVTLVAALMRRGVPLPSQQLRLRYAGCARESSRTPTRHAKRALEHAPQPIEGQ